MSKQLTPTSKGLAELLSGINLLDVPRPCHQCAPLPWCHLKLFQHTLLPKSVLSRDPASEEARPRGKKLNHTTATVQARRNGVSRFHLVLRDGPCGLHSKKRANRHRDLKTKGVQAIPKHGEVAHTSSWTWFSQRRLFYHPQVPCARFARQPCCNRSCSSHYFSLGRPFVVDGPTASDPIASRSSRKATVEATQRGSARRTAAALSPWRLPGKEHRGASGRPVQR